MQEVRVLVIDDYDNATITCGTEFPRTFAGYKFVIKEPIRTVTDLKDFHFWNEYLSSIKGQAIVFIDMDLGVKLEESSILAEVFPELSKRATANIWGGLLLAMTLATNKDFEG